MRILVTGGSGFLGSTFVRCAIAHSHTVAVLSRRQQTSLLRGASWLRGSLTEIPWDIIRAFRPEACVHAAWIATPGVYLESPENQAWVNWSLEFLRRLPELGVQHIVALGSCIEYQITGQLLCEDVTPIKPMSTYAKCKHTLHCRLRAASAMKNVSLAWARIFYPYGDGEHLARLASSLIARLRVGEPVTLKTARSVKDYIHVDDVATALLTLIENNFDGAVNIGTGDGVAVEAIARQLAEFFDRPELVSIPEPPLVDPLDFVVADSKRIRSLGWRPEVPLETGLRRLVETHCL